MREVWYVAHPVRGDVAANLRNVKDWLRWFFLNDPERVYIAPWVAEVEAMMELGFEERPDIVEKALADDVEVVKRCTGVVMVGGRITTGMAIERDAAAKVRDLSKYVTPADLERREP